MEIFSFLKTILVGCAGCGAVAVPLSGVSLKSPYSGGGTLKRSVHIIAKTRGKGKNSLKLFIDSTDLEIKPTNPKIKVWFEGKELGGKLLLCSPKSNQEYYLLKADDFSHPHNLQGVGLSSQYCVEQQISKMGEKLDIKIKSSEGGHSSQIPNKIDLDKCTVKDLRTGGEWRPSLDNSSLLELTCTEHWGNKKVTILSQGFEDLGV